MNKKRILLAVVFVVMVLITLVYAASENQSENSVDSNTNWGSFSATKLSDDVKASYTNSNQDWLELSDFQFVAVSGTIDTIRVSVEGSRPFGTSSRGDMDVQLIVGGNPKGDIIGYNLTAGADVIRQMVGTTDVVWGTAADVDSVTRTDFGVRIRDANTGAHNLVIDHILIHVIFTPDDGGGGGQILQTTFIRNETGQWVRE